MTYIQAEGKHGCKTAPTQKDDNLILQDQDLQSSYSEAVSNRARAKRSSSPEKMRKHVSWAKELETYPETESKRHQISAGAEPAQIKQFMNLQYNCKETQTEVQQRKAMTDSKVS